MTITQETRCLTTVDIEGLSLKTAAKVLALIGSCIEADIVDLHTELSKVLPLTPMYRAYVQDVLQPHDFELTTGLIQS